MFHKYKKIESPAIRSNAVGRASGGLVVMHNKQQELIESNKHWIFSKMRLITSKTEVIMGFLYLSPQYEYEDLIATLQCSLHKITEKHPELPLIITGDFNARIGNLNQGEEIQFINTHQNHIRSSLDEVENKNGRILTEMLEEEGLFVINGRSISDSPASFTYVSNNGKSTIDFVWTNITGMQLIKDFKISEDFHQSDHLPAIITLNLDIKKVNKKIIEPKPIIKWREEQKENLQAHLANLDINNQDYENFIKILWQIVKENNMVKFTREIKHYKKEWFDSDCYIKRKDVRRNLRLCKRNNFKDEHLKLYLTKKKIYLETLRSRKEQHQKLIQDKLKAVKNSKDFWPTINSLLHKKKTPSNKISIDTWENFHKSYYQPVDLDTTMFYSCTHPYMDDRITTLEVCRSVKALKNGKTPGPDGIINEVIKHLPENWILQLTKMFNIWLEKENLPKHINKGNLVMMFKSGDDTNPSNYRGIALLNTILKIFTQTIANRISAWAECFEIFHENQNGFRRQRACIDNIFVLSTIVQERLYKKKKKTYAIFVDFKKAFDSINHKKLWLKLFTTGISGKLCRTLRNLYNEATLTIQDNNTSSQPIKITKGVLQGDPLSALLFSLFINDMENFFRQQKLSGISITSKEDILMLLYADDLVILADSPVDTQRKLKALEEYAKNNDLEINTNKTKILHFHIGRQPKAAKRQFWYQQTPVEKTNKYNYLGTNFVSSGLHNETVKMRISKANIASGNLRRVMFVAKMNSWEAKKKMFEAIVVPTALYASEIWGLQHRDEVEKVTTNFYKRLFNWQKNTPNYIVRRETGQQHLAVNALKSTLRWWQKLLKMKNSRYPKKCYNLLLKTCENSTHVKHNWAYNLKTTLSNIGLEHIWTEQNHQIVKDLEPEIIETYKRHLYNTDTERIQNSSYNPLYKDLLDSQATYNVIEDENYNVAKILTQLRTSNIKRPIIYYKGETHAFEPEKLCDICNTLKPDDLFHFFFECPILTAHHQKYLSFIPVTDRNSFHRLLLNPTSTEAARAIHNFTVTATKTRTFAKDG